MIESTGKTRTTVGSVVSKKMTGTILVAVEVKVRHPKYGKYVKYTKKFFVHDPENQAQMHDRVAIVACRPISKNKTWRLFEVLERTT